MKLSSLILGAAVPVLAIAQGACDTTGFGKTRGGSRLTIELIGGNETSIVGTRLAPLPLSIDVPQPFRIVVRAVDPNGNVRSSAELNVAGASGRASCTSPRPAT